MWKILEQKKKEKKLNEFGNNLNEKYKNELKNIFNKIEISLKNASAENNDLIMNNVNYRNKFSKLCQETGIDPIICKKSIWSNMSDYYNKLALKLLFLLENMRNLNGGIVKISELINKYNEININKIDKSDVINSLKYLKQLGSGCEIHNNQYININHFLLKDDYFELIKIAEESGFINFEILKNKLKWNKERFSIIINNYLKNGMIWVDKQTESEEYNYYFLTI